MVDDGSFSPAVLAGCAVCDTGSAEASFNVNLPTNSFKSCDWLESSSLAAALSSAVAELLCTTLEIWLIPSFTCFTETACDSLAEEISSMVCATP